MKNEQQNENEQLNQTAVSGCADLKRLFNPGDAVIVKGNLMGAILNGYLWTFQDCKKFLYRVLVNGNDCAYRITNNNIDQTKDADISQEDYNTLMWHTEQIIVMEIFEEDLVKYECY